MLDLILLLIATALTVTFIICLISGKKYAYLVENLDSFEYFLKDIYVVGFVLNNTKIFKLRGKLDVDLKKYNKLVWDNVYFEYYATLAWAQFTSLAYLFLTIGLIFCSLLSGEMQVFALIIMLIAILAVWNMTITKTKDLVKVRREACIAEFPNMVSKLSLLINSGMVFREAWHLIANGKDGPLYDLMKKSCENMQNGDSEVIALYKFGISADTGIIKKFSSAVIQSIEKGNSELADFLIKQSKELWENKRQLSLQKGEIAAGKLIIPLGIMFAGIIMIIVSATMQSMAF